MKLFLLFLSVLVMLPAYGKDNMTFSGTLIDPPPCSINDKKDMSVHFDKVGVNKVDGINYQQPIDYIVTCTDLPGWTLALRLTGDAVTFLPGTIQTNVTGLGIRITINDQPMELTKNYVIDPSNLPKLKAVPVKDPGTVLTEGTFTASATLLALYQ
ncbi:Minor fimbrial subunit StfF [Serratia fonticola AU-P3(3)]|nr:Minor fimbrial subunit StfF [Serratia fonticola AU-P3(3)]